MREGSCNERQDIDQKESGIERRELLGLLGMGGVLLAASGVEIAREASGQTPTPVPCPVVPCPGSAPPLRAMGSSIPESDPCTLQTLIAK